MHLRQHGSERSLALAAMVGVDALPAEEEIREHLRGDRDALPASQGDREPADFGQVFPFGPARGVVRPIGVDPLEDAVVGPTLQKVGRGRRVDRVTRH